MTEITRTILPVFTPTADCPPGSMQPTFHCTCLAQNFFHFLETLGSLYLLVLAMLHRTSWSNHRWRPEQVQRPTQASAPPPQVRIAVLPRG